MRINRQETLATTSSFLQSGYPFIFVGLWFAGAALMILWSLHLCEGHLIYTLDDPYIHLAVAQTILQGGYGVNAVEYSSPSSSIAYPFILVLTEIAGLGSKGPLAINMLAMACAVYVVGRILKDHVLSDAPDGGWVIPKVSAVGLGLLACLIMNSWGLVMTGMEHSLHLLAVVVVLWGFLETIRTGRPIHGIAVAAIVALPVIRFEGLALSLCSIAALLYLRQWRASLVVTTMICSISIGWYGFTQSLGLPVLPSSVLLKSRVASDVASDNGLFELIGSVGNNLKYSVIEGRQGLSLLLVMTIVGCLTLDAWSKGARRNAVVIGGMAFFSGLAHVLFGSYGWFGRYEVYVLALLTLSALSLGRRLLTNSLVRFGIMISLLLLGLPFLHTALRTPAASRNIYEQQYQMHRFAVDLLKRPIAVNDLGWVSYGNPAYVLDLWGLGSEEVRRMKQKGVMNATSLKSLAERKNIAVIMIYDDWFKGIVPRTWQKVATLETSQVVTASGRVSIYATPVADVAEVRGLLQVFKRMLPSGALLKIEPEKG